MVSFVWAVILWSIAFVLVPMERIKHLWPIALVSFVWLLIVDYTLVHLGYYRFNSNNIPLVAGLPLFYLLGGSAGGLLMMNFMQRRPLYKIFIVLTFSGLLNLSSYIFELLGAFIPSKGFSHLIDFVLNIAGLSLLVWLSMEFVDEEKIYCGDKTRLFNK